MPHDMHEPCPTCDGTTRDVIMRACHFCQRAAHLNCRNGVIVDLGEDGEHLFLLCDDCAASD